MINCTIKKELPELLSKKKTVFIEPIFPILEYWKECSVCKGSGELVDVDTDEFSVCYNCKGKKESLKTKEQSSTLNPIEPSAKKGETEEVFWNKDSKYEWFCKWCGEALIPDEEDLMCCKECLNSIDRDILNKYELYHRRGQIIPKAIIFNKNIGKVKLTEDEFQIELTSIPEMIKRFGDRRISFKRQQDDDFCNNMPLDIISKGLGYKSAEEFFKEYNKLYDLSKPKKFNVKIGEWVD